MLNNNRKLDDLPKDIQELKKVKYLLDKNNSNQQSFSDYEIKKICQAFGKHLISSKEPEREDLINFLKKIQEERNIKAKYKIPVSNIDDLAKVDDPVKAVSSLTCEEKQIFNLNVGIVHNMTKIDYSLQILCLLYDKHPNKEYPTVIDKSERIADLPKNLTELREFVKGNVSYSTFLTLYKWCCGQNFRPEDEQDYRKIIEKLLITPVLHGEITEFVVPEIPKSIEELYQLLKSKGKSIRGIEDVFTKMEVIQLVDNLKFRLSNYPYIMHQLEMLLNGYPETLPTCIEDVRFFANKENLTRYWNNSELIKIHKYLFPDAKYPQDRQEYIQYVDEIKKLL